MATLTDRQVIELLASGATIYRNILGEKWTLVTVHSRDPGFSVQADRLGQEGWLVMSPNNGAMWLSDEGRKQFLKSTDEIGDGKLVPPKKDPSP